MLDKCTKHPKYKGIHQPRSTEKHPEGCKECWNIYLAMNAESADITEFTGDWIDNPQSAISVGNKALQDARRVLEHVRSGSANLALEIKHDGARGYVVTRHDANRTNAVPPKRRT